MGTRCDDRALEGRAVRPFVLTVATRVEDHDEVDLSLRHE